MVAGRGERQVPEVDREGQHGVATVRVAARLEIAGRAGNLPAVGIQEDEPDLVLVVDLGRRDEESENESEMRMAQRERPAALPSGRIRRW